MRKIIWRRSDSLTKQLGTALCSTTAHLPEWRAFRSRWLPWCETSSPFPRSSARDGETREVTNANQPPGPWSRAQVAVTTYLTATPSNHFGGNVVDKLQHAQARVDALEVVFVLNFGVNGCAVGLNLPDLSGNLGVAGAQLCSKRDTSVTQAGHKRDTSVSGRKGLALETGRSGQQHRLRCWPKMVYLFAVVRVQLCEADALFQVILHKLSKDAFARRTPDAQAKEAGALERSRHGVVAASIGTGCASPHRRLTPREGREGGSPQWCRRALRTWQHCPSGCCASLALAFS